MPKVSIICPVYNGSKYLKKCIDSLTNQTLQDIEFIFINDCSTDNSPEILQEYAASDARIKIYTQEKNGGQSRAKNKGLELASGEFVMLIDQDDWLEPETCERCYNQISANNNDLLLFDFNEYYQDKNKFIRYKKMIKPFADIINQTNIKLYEMSTDFFISGWAWCYMYRKSFLDKFDIRYPVDNRLVDDIPFVFKALVYADNISVIDEPFYNYRINNASVTSTRPDLWEEYFAAREKTFEIILDSPRKNDFILPYLAYYIRSIMYWYRVYKDYNGKAYYNKMRNLFIDLNNNYNIDTIKQYIGYKKFNQILKYNYAQYFILNELISNIFSIKNIGSFKVITILGFKIKLLRQNS